MAALVASDAPLESQIEIARRAFALDPTRDINPIPLISLIKGQRLRRVVSGALRELLGAEVDVEDLWKDFYCVATNYSKAGEEHIRKGPLLTALLASISIPGALPPVVRGGDLLCDGGTFNNFPVDVMQAHRGVGTAIGVDLSSTKVRRIDFDEIPSWWALALDRLRPRARRRYKLPSLASYLMNVTNLYSYSRRTQSRARTDVYFNPPLDRVGMLQWGLFEAIVRQGYEHAQQVIGELDAAMLARLEAK
jgi:NTE family protein